MNWDAIGAVGEIIGALAVVLTLVYLSIQIKENTRISKSEAYRESTGNWNDVFKIFLDADSELILNALKSYNSLESSQKLQFDLLMIALTTALESNLAQVEGEVADDVINEAVEDLFRRYFAYEGTLEWWQAGKGACAPSVRTWIDQRFKAPDLDYDFWGIRAASSSRSEED